MTTDARIGSSMSGVACVCAMWLLLAGCGGGSGNAPTYQTDLYAWQNGTFQRDVSAYNGANQIRVMLTQPSSETIVSQKTYDLGDKSAELPDLAFGEDLRLDFHLLNFSQEIVGWGASPRFSSGPDTPGLEFDVLMAETDAFAPVGGVYEPSGDSSIPCEESVSREDEFCQTRFDGRGLEGSQHRVGHTSAVTDDGRVLYVGGGQVNPSTLINPVPGFQKAFKHVQVFTPGDGYATNLAYNPRNRGIRAGDALSEARAYPEVTALGDGRYLVTGGYEVGPNGNPIVSRRIDMIDLTADPGSRVNQLTTAGGSNLKLATARARHTATYLPSLEIVLVTGGVTTSQTPTDSISIINLAQRAVGVVGSMQTARMAHEAVLTGAGSDQSRVWILGGRGGGVALGSTEFVTIDADRNLSTSSGPEMGVSRYDFGVVRYPTEEKDLYLVAGGYTSTSDNGRPTENVEVGDPTGSQGWLGSLTMQSPRGGATALRLPGSRGGAEVVVAGGRDAMAEPAATIQKISFDGSGNVPFSTSGITDGMIDPRYEAEVNYAGNGRVVFSGGVDPDGTLINTFEYYTPPVRSGLEGGE